MLNIECKGNSKVPCQLPRFHALDYIDQVSAGEPLLNRRASSSAREKRWNVERTHKYALYSTTHMHIYMISNPALVLNSNSVFYVWMIIDDHCECQILIVSRDRSLRTSIASTFTVAEQRLWALDSVVSSEGNPNYFKLWTRHPKHFISNQVTQSDVDFQLPQNGGTMLFTIPFSMVLEKAIWKRPAQIFWCWMDERYGNLCTDPG